MANVDNALGGFKPFLDPLGGNGQALINYYPLAAANTEIGIGTPVELTGGYVDIGTAGAGNLLLGIAAEYKAASSGGLIGVWSNPYQLFTAQMDDGTGTGTAEGTEGLNADFVGVGVSGILSTAELDENTADTTANLQFKLIRLSPEYQGLAQNTWGEFVRYVCMINQHILKDSAGTVGT